MLILEQARHALTADPRFSWASDGSRFSYLIFYDMLIKSVKAWTEAEQTQLIQWWNWFVFLSISGVRPSLFLNFPSRPSTRVELVSHPSV